MAQLVQALSQRHGEVQVAAMAMYPPASLLAMAKREGLVAEEVALLYESGGQATGGGEAVAPPSVARLRPKYRRS